MKQKLALCCALVHQPHVLLLDEPTTGVDPVSRKEFWDMLYTLKRKGITILVSTAYMDEAARCDRIALIQKGQILEMDTYAGVLQKHQHPVLAVRAASMHRLFRDLREYEDSETYYTFGNVHHVVLKHHNTDSIRALHHYLQVKGHHELDIREIPMDIEDIFIALMSKVA
jgi:ABC-type multidrug transport system ATPase subunit